MKLQEILKLYQSLSAVHGLPTLDKNIWDLTVTTERLPTAPAVMEKLIHMHPVTGWFGFQSNIQVMRTGEAMPVLNKDTGLLLNAEISDAAGHSVHVRYDSAGSWLVTKFTPVSGTKYLADIVKLVIHRAPGGFLYYRRYWELANTQGMVPVTACFDSIVTE
ncbi:hypothetical protein TI04_00730 [Achromatium sp. WMS2]|nr:hypothetical protein TI04_00730 [Achromatium sp. WMS2]